MNAMFSPMADLFGDAAPPGIAGLRYETEFLSSAEEADLVARLRAMALRPALYKGYTARRKVLSFGGRFDDDDNVLRPAAPLPEALHLLRSTVAQWLQVKDDELVHALVAEYAPGTPLGWHWDVPDFETIVGISLGGPAELRFRPYPPEPASNRRALRLQVSPRSIYAMQGEARWGWQHCVMPTEVLRWSVTFRTRSMSCGT
jgi:alkylated DNA repair dioxygenase AlkB